MGKIVCLDDIGTLLNNLGDSYHKGQLDGLIVITIDKDGEIAASAANVSYIEFIGCLDITKTSIHLQNLLDLG